MKSIFIIGNLGANAIRRTASDGKELMTFSVAVRGRDDQPVWFNCVSNLRDKLLPYLVKGQCVAVIGDLSVGMYNGRPDLEINVDRIELCGARPQTDTQTSSDPTPVEAQYQSFDADQQQII